MNHPAPDTARRPAGRPVGRPAGRPAGRRHFGAVAGVVLLFLAASAVPSPLYVVYQQMWGFSAATLTVVFAVYVLGLLAALLVLGALSDHVGRRPVLAGAIALEAVALVLFTLAGNVATLLLARSLQGIATGAAITTLAALLVDLHPKRAGLANGVTPLIGLALGALGAGALVQYAPAPTRLVYLLLLAGLAGAAVIAARVPETAATRPGALTSLRPRVGVAPSMRADFAMIAPALVASWALGGLYLSLGPSVAAARLGLHSHLVGGLVVTLLCGTGAATAIALHRRAPASLLAPAGTLLAAGTALTVIALTAGTVVLAAIGTVVAGLGFGAAALACFGTLGAIATPEHRGALFAAAYTVAYTSFSLPAVVAGVVAGAAGLGPTVQVYGAVVVVLGLATLGARVVLARRGRRGDAVTRQPAVSCPQA